MSEDGFDGSVCRDCGIQRYKARHYEDCAHYDAEQARVSLLTSAMILEPDEERRAELMVQLPERVQTVLNQLLTRRAQRRAARPVREEKQR